MLEFRVIENKVVKSEVLSIDFKWLWFNKLILINIVYIVDLRIV